MEVGQKIEAREHLWRSIRLDPRGWRKYTLLLAALLPGPVENYLRKLCHLARGRRSRLSV